MKLEEFGALIKANELFDLTVADMQLLKKKFGRLPHWINQETIQEWQKLCDEIIAILTTSIKTLRSRG